MTKEALVMGKNLSGKVGIVTGAARNLGRGFAEMLAAEGAHVVVHHHGEASHVEATETADRVRAHGRDALIVEADLGAVAAIDGMFEQAIQRFGRVDVLINNAGLLVKKPVAEITEDEFDRSFAINAKAAFFAMRAAARHMAEGGRIVNIGTTLLAAMTGQYSIYAGSKAPLEDFTRALAKEIGPRGITVNVVAPGPLNTSFYYPPETPQSTEYVKRQTTAGRLGEVDDIVPVVRFLVSPEARWLTGQTLFVNGGYLTR
jgi:NAD(P)-dependent dehydrogenase (short-subunit alcohol dehydrogenase family)